MEKKDTKQLVKDLKNIPIVIEDQLLNWENYYDAEMKLMFLRDNIIPALLEAVSEKLGGPALKRSNIKVERNTKTGGFMSWIRTRSGKFVLVDTSDTFDMGPESMAFTAEFDAKGTPRVTDWSELYARWPEEVSEEEHIISVLEAYDEVV